MNNQCHSPTWTAVCLLCIVIVGAVGASSKINLQCALQCYTAVVGPSTGRTTISSVVFCCFSDMQVVPWTHSVTNCTIVKELQPCKQKQTQKTPKSCCHFLP